MLLTTKLYLPPTRPELVSRPQLVKRINTGLHKNLTFISAPAGFGKTTLLSEWAIESPRPVTWLTLDESDNDVNRFFSYLVSALKSIDERIGRTIHPLLHAPQIPPAKSLVTILINNISPIDTPFTLVLDDFHTLVEISLLEAMRFFLDHLPPQMHLVIATRKDPPLPLVQLRVQGQITELRANDLRFSYEEATLFLTNSMGLTLSEDDMKTLEARTEGWIAGLQLAALSLQRYDTQSSRSDFVHAFAGDNHHIMDYLVEEVLHRQPEDVQSFLLQSSVLERLCGPLCDAVVYDGESKSNGRSQQYLAFLDQVNLFMIPLDNRRRWYRYHHLFGHLLYHHLQHQQPQNVPRLHLKASEWYEHEGHLDQAIHHALKAKDYERAATLIEPMVTQLVKEGNLSAALGWLAKLPTELIHDRLWLSVASAWANLLAGKVDRIVPFLRAIESQLADMTPETLAEYHNIRSQVFGIRAFMARWQGDLPGSLRFSQQAFEHLPDNSYVLHTSLALNLGNIYSTLGNLSKAQVYYNDVVSINRQTDCNYYSALMALGNLAAIQMQMGHLHKSETLFNQAIELGTYQGGGQPLPATANAFVGQGMILYEWNRLDEAAVYVNQGIELAQLAGDIFVIIHGFVLLSYIKYAQGDLDTAAQLLDQARKKRSQAERREEDGLISSIQVRLWLKKNNFSAISRWVKEKAGQLENPLDRINRRNHLTLTRILIAQKQPNDALLYLRRLLDALEQDGSLGQVIEVLNLMAIAYHLKGQTKTALTTLERALLLAEPEGYIRTFVDEGQALASLLYQAAKRDILPDYTGRLLALFARRQSLPIKLRGQQHDEDMFIEPLSKRELEVLKLVMIGAKNLDIAETLVISVNTVKNHLKNIYSKLHVRSRMQATERARELNIFSSPSD